MSRNQSYKIGNCIHCKRKIEIRGRGLCSRCYQTKSIRVQYPQYRIHKKSYHPDEQRAMPNDTIEEVERVIAEQLANKPNWWAEETYRVLCASLEDIIKGRV